MGYRPTPLYSTFLGRRLGPSASAIVPASIMASLIGTATLLAINASIAIASGALPLSSFGNALSMLVLGGVGLVIGTIAGSFAVGFYLVIFGMPISTILGDRIRKPIGLGIAILSGLLATAISLFWMGPVTIPNLLGTNLAALVTTLAFSLPAMILYRHHVITMRDELDED